VLRFYIVDLFDKQTIESKYIIFDMKCCDKCQFATVLDFQYRGFNVFLSVRTFLGMDIYVQKIVKRSGIKPIIIQKYDDYILFTDSLRNYNKFKKSSIFLRYNYFDKSMKDPVITYPFHVGHYLNKTKWIGKDQNQKFRIRLLFNGSVNSRYTNKSIKGFNVVERNKSIEIIQSKFPSLTYCPRSKEELLEELESGRLSEKIVLVIRENFSLSKQDYASLLSSSDFFLALPGMVNPISHNLTESLHAGSIPICQYVPLYDYALRGLCLEYNDEPELIEKIEYALKMDNDSIDQLQQGLKRYIFQRNQFIHDLVNKKFSYAFVNTEKLSLYSDSQL
jgi:hypothetical protein